MKIIISISIALLCVLGAWYFLSTSDKNISPVQVETVNVPEISPQIKIIAFGDSLTAGLGLPLTHSYPAQLEQRLRERGYAVEVINSGVSGETTAGNNLRAEFIRGQNPDIVLFGIGGNDALRFLSVDEAYMNMRSTLSTLLSGENPPRVLLLSMQAPSNAGAAYKASFDALYVRLATEFKIPLVPFIIAEVSRNPEFLLDDGIHPTKEGYTLLVDTYIFPAVQSLLETLEI